MSKEHDVPPQEDENAEKEGIQSETEEQEEFSFLQETIKDEQPNGKRRFYKFIKLAGSGVIFGLAACVAFFSLKPWAETKFQKDPSEIVIPQDSEEDEQQDADAAEDVEVQVQQELTIESHRELNEAIYEVASVANKSVVEVTAVNSDDSWMTDTYDNKESVAGLYFDDNGQDVLIITYSSITEDAESLIVTFADNLSYSASLKKRDANLGIAVIGVPRSSIKQTTWSQIEQGVLGNSKLTSKGDSVIAIGNQFGYASGLGYGIISSTKNTVMKADGEYSIISTDIAAADNGTGVLVNLNGEVIGLIDQSISATDSMNLVTAFAISDLKSAIEDLGNVKGVPYIGIWGVDISETLSTEQGMPQGIYVKEVNADSPAMNAGIKSGDIITSFAGNAISNLQAYNKAVMESSVGKEIKLEGKRQGPEGYVDITFEVTIGSNE